ncbi:hypothetical protein M758_1G052200 [Ceratodon purpureus]|nr:hypothetical protein M758_1G052200 [Ceratodon purpureus]
MRVRIKILLTCIDLDIFTFLSVLNKSKIYNNVKVIRQLQSPDLIDFYVSLSHRR